MTESINVCDVGDGGNTTLHAVEETHIASGVSMLVLQNPGAPLVAPGSPKFLDFDPKGKLSGDGSYVNLHNNVWGTNFPMWFGEDFRARFRLVLGE